MRSAGRHSNCCTKRGKLCGSGTKKAIKTQMLAVRGSFTHVGHNFFAQRNYTYRLLYTLKLNKLITEWVRSLEIWPENRESQPLINELLIYHFSDFVYYLCQLKGWGNSVPYACPNKAKHKQRPKVKRNEVERRQARQSTHMAFWLSEQTHQRKR